MPLSFAKRLLIYLTVVAFIAVPWAQAFAQSSGCEAPTVAAAGQVAMHAGHKARSGELVSRRADPANKMVGSCVKNCTLPLNLMVPSVSVSFEAWPQVQQPMANVALHGRTLEPELLPPIALI